MLLAWILAFIIAITVHEAAHAYMADRLGDPTAKLMGRLSLNPIVHYDKVGTTLLVFTTALTFLGLAPFPFGWAKPVQFDPYNLRNPRRDSALISLAGPGTNLLVAFILSLVVRLAQNPFSPFFALAGFLVPIILLNVVLAIFNLIPIHPLDGGKILVGLLPEKEAHDVDIFLRRYGMILLFLMIFPTFGGVSPISALVGPAVGFVLRLLLPGAPIL